MPLFLLYLRAELENVESVSLAPGTQFLLDVKNSAGEDERRGVAVDASEEVPLSGSRGTAHFALKWARDARHEASLSLQEVKGVTRALTAADSGEWVPVMGFECRGLDPVAYSPAATAFTVRSTAGGAWEGADLSEDWAEYDERGGGVSVSVMGLEGKFEVYKPKK